MLIQKIKALCTQYGVFVIVDRADDSQWLGTPAALYPVHGVRLDESVLCTLLDIDEDKREKYRFVRVNEAALTRAGYSLADTADDIPLTSGDITFLRHGETIVPMALETGYNVLFANTAYTAPLVKYFGKQYFARRGRDGEYYIVVKSGYQLIAVIAAEQISDGSDFLKEIHRLSELLKLKTAAGAMSERGCILDINIHTGEMIEKEDNSDEDSDTDIA